MSSLRLDDFPDFFKSVWNHRPFDWQVRLLNRVRSSEGWPHTLDLPTGAGKTASLDIALFALALDAFTEPSERRQARRVALVVDRRVVVDQAYARAVHLAEVLQRARDGVVARVADALRALQGGPTALPILPPILRGGMPRESDWARTPHQPVLLISTVDQVGSRLLFRGYGVGHGMRSVHAGLLGQDTLYLLDEVHLSRPFEETLDAITRFYGSVPALAGASRPLRVVRMSATVAERASAPFELSPAERAEPMLARRLEASKRAVLREVRTPREPERAREALAEACVGEVLRLVANGSPRVIAVIVNRVDTARRVAVLATSALIDGWDVKLITGAMRPLDRAELQRHLLDRIRAGRTRTEEKLLLVSTQAVEAGADFDFDALVTECASLDALRQRFGRLDRLGDLRTSDGVIIAGTHSVNDSATADPVYGDALRATWRWLVASAATSNEVHGPVVDFGVEALGTRLASTPPDILKSLLSPRTSAPVLVASHLDRWVQTSPAPSADPDVTSFLHGPGRGGRDVLLVWRADILRDWLVEDALDAVRHVLQAVPPSALEALSLPLWAARRWLADVLARDRTDAGERAAGPTIADVEGVAEPTAEEPELIAPTLIWAGDDTRLAVTSNEIGPGDTLVVPATYGGVSPTFRCWDPDATEPVRDRGDEAQLLHRARAVIRWSPVVLRDGGLPADAPLNADLASASDPDEVDADGERDAFEGWRRATLSMEGIPKWASTTLDALATRSEIIRVLIGDSPWRATWQPRRVSRSAVRAAAAIPVITHNDDDSDATTEDDEGSFTGSRVSLDRHLAGVEAFARRFAEALSLPDEVRNDLALAGRLHDLGKADPRFQLMLNGGDAVRHALDDELLAKSDIPVRDRARRERARAVSGYPRGMRHELMSVALIEHNEAVASRAADWDLVLHLVASHHGWCRPFAPLVLDRSPVAVEAELEGLALSASSGHSLARIDSGVADRFWRLVRRYGWWGLAWLEAIMRLADHRESEQEQVHG